MIEKTDDNGVKPGLRSTVYNSMRVLYPSTMKTNVATTVVVAVLVLAAMSVPVIVLASSHDDGQPGVAPGERLMGSVGVQQAELSAEVEERAFGLHLTNVLLDGDEAATAALIAENVEEQSNRLAELEQRLATLEEQHEAGEVSTGQYRAEVAKLEVERHSIVRTLNASVDVADGLPVELLEEHGVNTAAILELQENASDLGGENVREIARSIAGNSVGAQTGDRPGVGERVAGQAARAVADVEGAESAQEAVDIAEQWVDRAERFVQRAETRVNKTPGAGPAVDALADARADLAAAQSALTEAQAALEAGDDMAAQDHASDAMQHAANAIESADAAFSGATGPPDDTPDEPSDGA